MFIADDAAFGIYISAKFFFLLRAEKSNLPMPRVYFRGHQLVCLFQSNGAFEICFYVVVHRKNNCGFVSIERCALLREKTFRAIQRFIARNLKIYGSFGKSLKIIMPRNEHAKRAQQDPAHQDAQILRAETLKSRVRCSWGRYFRHTS